MDNNRDITHSNDSSNNYYGTLEPIRNDQHHFCGCLIGGVVGDALGREFAICPLWYIMPT